MPAWVLRLPTLGPGPKALYASFCTNADEHGKMWRALDRVADELAVSRRQVQRWLKALEAAGLLVRIWHGRKAAYLLIRNPAGRAWATHQNLKGAVARNRKAWEKAAAMIDAVLDETFHEAFHETVSEAVSETVSEISSEIVVPQVVAPILTAAPPSACPLPPQSATPMSQGGDTSVAVCATPMSPKHNPSNRPTLTDRAKADVAANASAHRITETPRVPGLRLKTQPAHAALLQEKLNELADDVGGWETLLGYSPAEQVELLAAKCGEGVPRAEVERVVGMGS